MRLRVLVAAVLFATPLPAAATPCVVRVVEVADNDFRNSFYKQFLQLALAKTAAVDGACQLQMTEDMTHNRKFRAAEQGVVDVIWNVSSLGREAQMLPIRIPVHRGMHGLRVLAIRRGEEARFAGRKSLAELRSLVAGQIFDWQAAEVWRGNNLPYTHTNDFESLFRMLQRQRFDYIPLSLFEAWGEVDKRPQLQLTIEPTLLLQYPSTDYYFVASSQPKLAQRIERGIELAIADGSRDELWNRHFNFAALLGRLRLTDRTIIDLINPTQPLQVPVARKEFWLTLEDLLKFKP